MKNIYPLILGFLLFTVTNCEKTAPAETLFKNGVVTTAHPLATQVGLDILKKGGNAFDAAIAVQFALAVTYPRAGNIGGGGFMVYRDSSGKAGSLDFREKAPLAATKNMYLDSAGNPIENASLKGVLAAGVPGSVDGMVKIHEKFGTLPWKQLVDPAIEIARKGVTLTAGEASKLNDYLGDFDTLNRFPVPTFKTGTWKKGDLIVYNDLANTLSRIAEKGREGFYGGETAQYILEEMNSSGGIISEEDLKQYESVWRPALTTSYKNGFNVITMPPPSSGGVALIQLMKGAAKYDLAAMGHNSAQYIHLLTELMRRVYADRATYLGDPDFFDVPVEMLTSKDYLQERNASIQLNAKTDSKEIKAGNVQVIESFETTHFSIVDKNRNAVAITTTLNGNYGCKVMVKGAGFFLNNEMDDFSIKPGVPNQFGLVGGEANAIVPEKRMLSSMTPTIVEKNGQLYLVVGTPGGSTIITTVFQTILNVVEFNMTIQEATDAPKMHAQWLPDEIYLEENKFPTSTQTQLQQLGHQLSFPPILGKMNCIMLLPDRSLLEGAADTLRSEGTAAGF